MNHTWARLCAALTIAALFALAFTPTSSATTTTATGMITGRVESTWLAAGGSEILGDPIGTETKLVVSARNTYHQHTTYGATVYWDGSQGGKVWVASKVPSLSGVSAERDALGRYGFKSGALFRSAKLCNATTANKRLMVAMLHGGLILDLRTSGTCTEPNLPYVTETRVSVPSHADYARYINATERAAFGKALRTIAAEDGPVWVHCTAGKDRTGWTVALIMSILGADQGDILAEYLRTSGADEADLFEGLDAVAAKYGDGGTEDGMTWTGMGGYVRQDLGLDQATIDKLRAKFGA